MDKLNLSYRNRSVISLTVQVSFCVFPCENAFRFNVRYKNQCHIINEYNIYIVKYFHYTFIDI